MHFIISDESYNAIEEVVYLNRSIGLVYLISIPVVLCLLCFCLSMYNEDEPKKVPIMYKIYFFIVIVIISIEVLYRVNLKYTQTLSPRGCLLYTYYSPNKKNIIEVYNLTYAFLDRLYRGCRIDCVDMHTKERRSIYFNGQNSRPSIEWKDNNNVIINSKKINIKNGYYNDYNNDS